MKSKKAFTFVEMLISLALITIFITGFYFLSAKLGIFDMDDSGIFATKQEIELKNIIHNSFSDQNLSIITEKTNTGGSNFDYLSLSGSIGKTIIGVISSDKTRILSGSDAGEGYLFIKNYSNSATIDLSNIDLSTDSYVYTEKINKFDISTNYSLSGTFIRFDIKTINSRKILFLENF